MGVMEQRCRDWCKRVLNSECEETGFTIEWKKSYQWGSNPVIKNWMGEKMVCVTGCGFDKHSQALVDLLKHLFPPFPEDGFNYGGHGVDTVVREMAARGWELKRVAFTDATDTYVLRRMK